MPDTAAGVVNFGAAIGAVRIWAFTLCLPDIPGRSSVISRMLLAALLTLAFAGAVSTRGEVSCLAVLSETYLGLCAAMPLLVAFQVLQAASELVEQARGHNLAATFDPLFETEAHAFPLLQRCMFLYLLLSNGLFELILRMLAHSFDAFPSGGGNARILRALAAANIDMISDSLGLILAAFAPYACAVGMVDLFVIAVARLVPSISLQQEGYILRTVVVLAVFDIVAGGQLSWLQGILPEMPYTEH